MSLLNWRGWDWLDELDHRMGLRRPSTKKAVARMRRFLWVVAALPLMTVVVEIVERNWLSALTGLVLVGVVLSTNRRVAHNQRERAGY